jgi:hypothetical protein
MEGTAMPFLFCHHKVADFDLWKRVFDSHAAAQKEAGLTLQYLLRNLEDPNDVFMLFKVEEIGRAKTFVTSPDVPGAQNESDVMGKPEVYFLS